MKIGLLSDTHGYIHPKIIHFLRDSDEIWHAGDIGDPKVIEDLEKIAKVRAVYGNIDGTEFRKRYNENLIFQAEGIKVYMTHIGGYPGKYHSRARKLIKKEMPKLFISGHSHILKIMNDPEIGLLHINPGASGRSGFHKAITAVHFEINGDRIENLELIDIPRS